MRTILHSDLNNFFASVECFLNPELNGHPVAVAGNPEMRHGIVLAKNYEAKRYGVSTGEALWEARLKCPDIIFVPPHYDKYMEYSKAAKEIYYSYTDQVESYGLDECWLDVTGSSSIFGDGKTIADSIRCRIKRELGVTVSVGVSYNKIFAKLGSDMKKPDATTVIPPESFREVIWGLPVSDLLYVGRSTFTKLKRFGINTIGELAKADPSFLNYILGKTGLMLHAFANGQDTSPVSNIGAKSLMKSVSCGTTAFRDLVSEDDVKIMLFTLSTTVSRRLREYGFMCSTVQLVIRNGDLSSFVRQERLPYPCRTSEAIFSAAFNLFKKNHKFTDPVRTLSVCATDFIYTESEQMSFDEELSKIQRRENLEIAFDEINNKYGEGTIKRGILMSANDLCRVDLKNSPGILPGRMK